MRKHPLIALIAFAFLAVSIFIGAASASSFNSIPARAVTHLKNGETGSSAAPTWNIRWLTTAARKRATAAAQAAALIASEKNSPAWQGRAADQAAIHDVARPTGVPLPSLWHAAILRAAAAHAAAVANANAQAALQAQQQQAALQAQQQQAALAAQAAQAARAAQAAQAARAAQAALAARAAQAAQQRAKAAKATEAAQFSQSTNPAQAPVAHVTTPSVLGGAWLSLRMCESGDNYSEDTGNGYYGAYQFALATWWGLGYSGLPNEAPPAVQDQAAEQLQARSGWRQWPACSAELGL
jgi:hypothetical protein